MRGKIIAMTDVDDLLRRVFAKANATVERLPATATAEEVENAESILGFTLPPMLTRLHREVANGGFGPDYQLLPLTGEGRTAVSDYCEEPATRTSGETRWPAEVLPILDWGCGMYAAVDCRSPRALRVRQYRILTARGGAYEHAASTAAAPRAAPGQP
ncbi:SMI1/KNR4 family protein [Microtetraspora sp. NBRC 13810]|uniref:SMI1/KNR4 family protein n=1 Tax=Microtetraspora sp. NBRC 13810 TaxID=3030990 RepID=UPI002554B480|nr:SMI1/KNR4 family protein [Microtetraspora sp. NBRC 13810]